MTRENSTRDYINSQLKIAGASIVADFFSHPFLTMWTVQQSHFFDPSVSLHSMVRETYKNKRLFDGFFVGALSSIPGTFLYLKGRESALNFFGDNHIGQVMQGPMGVICGMSVWSPASRLMMLKQASHQKNTIDVINQLSLPQKAKTIFKKNGIRGFYCGALSSTLSFSLTDALGSWLQAQILQCYPLEERSNVVPQVLSTALAFGLAVFVFSPIDVAVAHLRIQESNTQKFHAKEFQSAAKNIYAARGARGFFVGATASVAHAVTWHMILPFTTAISNK